MTPAADTRRDSDQSTCTRQRRLPSCRRLGLLFVAAITLAGCLSQPGRHDEPGNHIGDAEATLPPVGALAVQESPPRASPAAVDEPSRDDEIWWRLRGGFAFGTIEHPRIEQEIRRLTRSPNAFRALMARSEPYLFHILGEIEAAGLPSELALLPAVESGFRPHAYSPDGAAGLWQFMPATGRMLGLQQNWWLDRRRTVRASTKAAITYLSQLNDRFSGDWLHALAAYNAGAGTVSRAMRRATQRGEDTDFWSLDLPGETDRYVPRLLAVARIVADPEAYGLDLPEVSNQPYFTITETGGQIDLTVAASIAKMPVEDLLALNAGHRRWATGPDGPHELLLPVEAAETVGQSLAKLAPDKRLRWQRHTIRRGDSLSRIARRYGVNVDTIKRTNNMQDSRIRAGRDLLIPLSNAVSVADGRSNRQARQRMHYRVRKGDSLYDIARRFQVSVADLKRWNRVGRYIRPGERLTVFIDPDA